MQWRTYGAAEIGASKDAIVDLVSATGGGNVRVAVEAEEAVNKYRKSTKCEYGIGLLLG